MFPLHRWSLAIAHCGLQDKFEAKSGELKDAIKDLDVALGPCKRIKKEKAWSPVSQLLG